MPEFNFHSIAGRGCARDCASSRYAERDALATDVHEGSRLGARAVDAVGRAEDLKKMME
jgi:hypothetical protein